MPLVVELDEPVTDFADRHEAVDVEAFERGDFVVGVMHLVGFVVATDTGVVGFKDSLADGLPEIGVEIGRVIFKTEFAE